MTPTTNTPAVKTTALVVPTVWIETPQREITTLRRVCVQVTDFYSEPAVSGKPKEIKNEP